MNKLNNLYEQITPKTSPEELSERIMSTPELKKAPNRKTFRPAIALAATGIAVSSLVVTAGAVNGWDYSAVFESIFGEKAQNITESTLSQARIIRDDMEGLDFEVVAAAADKHSALVILDVFSKDGTDLSEINEENLCNYVLNNLHFSFDGPEVGSWSLGTSTLEESKEKVRLRLNMSTEADISGSDIRIIARRYGSGSDETVFTGKEDSWIAEFTADYTAMDFSYENAMHLEAENSQGKTAVLDVTDVTITPITAYINGTGTGDYFVTVWNFEENYAVTADGEKVYFTDIGSGSFVDNMESCTESLSFAFETPVNPEDITAIVIGNETIELK